MGADEGEGGFDGGVGGAIVNEEDFPAAGGFGVSQPRTGEVTIDLGSATCTSADGGAVLLGGCVCFL